MLRCRSPVLHQQTAERDRGGFDLPHSLWRFVMQQAGLRLEMWRGPGDNCPTKGCRSLVLTP
jgi:hypothetical protein